MPYKPLVRAFPSVLLRDSKGMLLRDYFACGIASGYVGYMGYDSDAEAIARSAYKLADAMMRVREEKQETQEEADAPTQMTELE